MEKGLERIHMPIKWINRISLTIGVALLTCGIVFYIRLVMTGKGALIWSFVCLMSCLMFFNLPVVIQKRRDRKVRQEKEQ